MDNSVNVNGEFLLEGALAGSTDSLGKLLQTYSDYLKLLVLTQRECRLQSRVSPSDIVQETFLEASRDFTSFRGSSVGEFRAWLRKILVNNIRRVVEQHLLTKKRDVRREVSAQGLAESLEQSSARLDAILASPEGSPSAHVHQQEVEARLASQLASLPYEYREVIMLRHVDALPFEEVAIRMNRTNGSARMLWLRAIKLLRELMQVDSR